MNIDYLTSSDPFGQGCMLVSENGRYKMKVELTGELVVYDIQSSKLLWSNNLTWNVADGFYTLYSSGNFLTFESR